MTPEILAMWGQTLTGAIGIFLIYWQLGQVREQMIQNDDQAKGQRAWEFINFYSNELRFENDQLAQDPGAFPDILAAPMDSEPFQALLKHFYTPRIPMFKLLNQLMKSQQVDERMLFEYLSWDFNRFVQVGVKAKGVDPFKATTGIQLLLSAWAPHLESRNLLYGVSSDISGTVAG